MKIKPKVTGIGGIFFKSPHPEKLKAWYTHHLGFETDQWGAKFNIGDGVPASKAGFLQWSVFEQSTSYMDPSSRPFMINYRVQNLEGFVEQLRKHGVYPLDSIDDTEFGKFVHIMDPDGNKIELWEPSESTK